MKIVKSKRPSTVVRRSVALPRQLVEEAASLAPRELRGNWNRLVREALEQFIIQCKRRRFAESMAEMAKDPQAMALNRQISEEFSVTDSDGLS
jgi:metal-responsive CopG/Arc/MetJ family transcriptional regulator